MWTAVSWFLALGAACCTSATDVQGEDQHSGSPRRASSSQSIVTVSAGVVHVDDTAIVTLLTRDSLGNDLTTGGLTVTFMLVGGTSDGSFGPTVDHGDGTYQADFVGTVAGNATAIRATIDGDTVTSAAPTIQVVTPQAPPGEPVCEATGGAHCWYVAADAAPGGDGSFDAPFRIPQDAADRARPGDYIYLSGEFRRGPHGDALISHGGRTNPTVDGEPDRPITVKSYPGQQAVGRGVLSDGVPTPDRYGIWIVRSYWHVVGLRLVNGGVRIGNDIGSGTRGVRLEGNHLSDYFCNIGNCGIISLSGQAHGQAPSSDPTQDSRDIWIVDNTVHTLWGMQPDGSGPVVWQSNVDVEHHACFAGFAFYRDIHVYDNRMYHCPSAIYFKWTSPGPIFIDGNDFGPVRAFGRSRAQDVRCGQNRVSVLLPNTFRYTEACG